MKYELELLEKRDVHLELSEDVIQTTNIWREYAIEIRHKILKNNRLVYKDFWLLALYKTSLKKFIKYWGLIRRKDRQGLPMVPQHPGVPLSYMMDKEKFKLYYKAYYPESIEKCHIQFTIEGIPRFPVIKRNF